MRVAAMVAVLACVCSVVSSSDSKRSCVDQTMTTTISGRTCEEIPGSEADIAAMAITACLLRRFQKPPDCLNSGGKHCLKSLTPKVYSSYRAVRSKWRVFCDGAQQANVLERLREAVKSSEELLDQLSVAAEDVEKNAVKGVESKLLIGEAVDDMDGSVDDVVGEVEKAREIMDAEVSKIAGRMDEQVKSLNNKAEEICDDVHRITTREVRNGGVVVGAYACLGGIIVGCGKRWHGILGGFLILSAIVCELLGKYKWPVRLGLLSYCSWLVAGLDPHRNTSMERKSEVAGDDDDESEDCDCCFDDHLDAH